MKVIITFTLFLSVAYATDDDSAIPVFLKTDSALSDYYATIEQRVMIAVYYKEEYIHFVDENGDPVVVPGIPRVSIKGIFEVTYRTRTEEEYQILIETPKSPTVSPIYLVEDDDSKKLRKGNPVMVGVFHKRTNIFFVDNTKRIPIYIQGPPYKYVPKKYDLTKVDPLKCAIVPRAPYISWTEELTAASQLIDTEYDTGVPMMMMTTDSQFIFHNHMHVVAGIAYNIEKIYFATKESSTVVVVGSESNVVDYVLQTQRDTIKDDQYKRFLIKEGNNALPLYIEDDKEEGEDNNENTKTPVMVGVFYQSKYILFADKLNKLPISFAAKPYNYDDQITNNEVDIKSMCKTVSRTQYDKWETEMREKATQDSKNS